MSITKVMPMQALQVSKGEWKALFLGVREFLFYVGDQFDRQTHRWQYQRLISQAVRQETQAGRWLFQRENTGTTRSFDNALAGRQNLNGLLKVSSLIAAVRQSSIPKIRLIHQHPKFSSSQTSVFRRSGRIPTNTAMSCQKLAKFYSYLVIGPVVFPF